MVIQSGGTVYSREEIQVQSGGSITNSGTLYSETGIIDIDNGGTITVNSGGILTSGSNDNIEIQGTLVNNGTVTSNSRFNVSATGNVTVGSTGLVNVALGTNILGTMSIAGDFNANGTGGTEDFEIDGGYVTVQSGGTLNAADDIDVINGGTLEIQSGGTVNSTDDVRNQGSQGTIIVNGTLDVGGDVNFTNSTPDSEISGFGTIDVGGSFNDAEGGPFTACMSFPCSLALAVEIQNAPNSSSVMFSVTIQIGQDVTGFVIGDIVVGNGSASNLVSVDANTYTIDITPNGTGSVTIDIPANVVNENNNAATQVVVPLIGPGDVMFVGYSSESDNPVNTLGDGMAFVTLVDLPANQVIYLTDHEWDRSGESWINDNNDSNDTYYTWTNGASVLPAGSIVYFYGTAAQVFTTVGGGSTTSAATQEIGDVGNTNEVLYMYTANSANHLASTIFLSALATDGFDDFGGGTGYDRGDLPTSLTIGTNAIEFTNDEELTLYNGPTDCGGTLLACQMMIADPTNWVTDVNTTQGSGGGTASWPPSDGPVGSGSGFSGAALPVVWLSFEGEYNENERMVILNWTTASEENNLGFAIERSLDGVEFEELGFVEGNGTTSFNHSYDFIDPTIELSSYYRLRQVDYDGKYDFSKWIFVSVIKTSEKGNLFLYPNPTSGEFKIGGSRNELYDITVTSVGGEFIMQLNSTNLTFAEIKIKERLSSFSSGIYLIQFSNPGFSNTLSLIKR